MSLFHQKTQSEHQMGIAPLDLQTLYSQLDKIGKTQGSQAQILRVQNALQDVEKSKQAGMNAHLSKPVDIDALKLTLGRLITERKQEGK